jgi:GH24 family phage-related lysozyme (muramidase)
VYNIGITKFIKSEVDTYVNSLQYEKAAVEMMKYVSSDGKILPGLVRRRRQEVERFLLDY